MYIFYTSDIVREKTLQIPFCDKNKYQVVYFCRNTFRPVLVPTNKKICRYEPFEIGIKIYVKTRNRLSEKEWKLTTIIIVWEYITILLYCMTCLRIAELSTHVTKSSNVRDTRNAGSFTSSGPIRMWPCSISFVAPFIDSDILSAEN